MKQPLEFIITNENNEEKEVSFLCFDNIGAANFRNDRGVIIQSRINNATYFEILQQISEHNLETNGIRFLLKTINPKEKFGIEEIEYIDTEKQSRDIFYVKDYMNNFLTQQCDIFKDTTITKDFSCNFKMPPKSQYFIVVFPKKNK